MRFLYFVFLLFSLYYKSQNYISEWYTMDNGLPQNSVKDIIKDKYGFIWMTTENGIVRYDGKKFLLQDNLGLNNLHFGTFRGNINKDSIIAFNDYETDAVLIHNKGVKLMRSHKFEKLFSIKNNKSYKNILKNTPKGLLISKIDYYTVETNLGTYYFGNNSIKFRNKYNKESTINVKFNQNDLIGIFLHGDTLFIVDHVNRKTLVLHGDHAIFDDEASLYNNPKSKIFWSKITNQIFVVNDGNIYLSQYTNGKLKLTFLVRYSDIEKKIYNTIYYDQDFQKLYLGSPSKGLNIVTITNFNISLKNRPFEDEVFYSFLPLKNNSVITSDGTEYFNNKNDRLFFEASFFYPKRTILLYDNSENLVYSDENMIYKRYKAFNYKKEDSLSFKDRSILSLFRTENLYIGALSDAFKSYLYIFENDDFRKVKSIVNFPGNIIRSVLRYNDDLLYVGCNDGLYIVSVSKNKIIKKIKINVIVKQIIKSKDHNIWFTTFNNGFYLLKNNFPIRMPEDVNHYLTQAHYFLEDSKGNYWITSNNGLFKVRKKALLDYAYNKKSKVFYYRYTKENGFLNNEFNGSCNVAGNELENGEFVFPSMEGLVFFTPHEIKNYYPKPNQLYIETAVVDDKKITMDNGLTLKSDFIQAVINIDIPYYYDLDNIYLEAKLDGYTNSNWERIADNRQYILNNKLEPGKYNLIIRFLISEDGKFVYKTIPIEIKPYFYQTLLFKLFSVIIVILIIIWIIWSRTHLLNDELKKTNSTLTATEDKLKSQSEYQKNLIESINHDITTPLKFIASLSQKFLESDDPDVQKECFESIYNSSEQLYKFTLGLKEYIHLHKDENVENNEEYALYDVIESKRLLFNEIAKQNGVVIQNFSDKKIKTVINKDILSVIIHNIIDNAVKYTSEGQITINTYYNSTQIEIRITDTGEGMTDEQINYYTDIFKSTDTENLTFRNYGLGLHMVIQLVKKIKSEIYFYKKSPKGTVIKIIINKHLNDE